MLILGGAEIPNTQWIHDGRTCDAWWKPGDWGTKRRTTPIDLLVGHWTAGEAGLKTFDDDGPFVVRVMRNRPSAKIPDQKMKVSIHFVIGGDGRVWQTADPLTTVAIHVGDGRVNARSIGVEIVSCGLPPCRPERPRDTVTLESAGRACKQLLFHQSQIDSWRKLADALTVSEHEALKIPRAVPATADGKLLCQRFTEVQCNAWRGVMEHFHVPSTTKVDAGSQLIRACLDHGYALAPA